MFVINNRFVCELDGSIFPNEEELVAHIRNKHVTAFNDKKTDASDIYDILSANFPDWKARVESGTSWYAGYIIKLNKDNTQIKQYYDNEKTEDYSSCHQGGNPENYDDLIKEIQYKIDTYIRMTTAIKNIGEFEDVYCKEFDYGYSSDEHHFTFMYKLNEREDYDTSSFYPWSRDNNGEEDFVNDFKKYFVNMLEGVMTSDYDEGYFVGYTIDGVNIDGLISRAKKVRLEIIE